MVRTLQQRLADQANVSVEYAALTSLRFADQSFDFVASYLMLHHVLDWQRALAEAACVLRPGGTFVGYDLTKTRVA